MIWQSFLWALLRYHRQTPTVGSKTPASCGVKCPCAVMGFSPLLQKNISALKTQCKEAFSLIRMFAHMKWERDTLLMLYQTIVHSKLDYGGNVCVTASNTNLQLNNIHNTGLKLTLGAFCTNLIPNMYTEAKDAPLEENRLNLPMHYYQKTRACTENPVYDALHEFDQTTRDLYLHRPNGRGGMTRLPTQPVGLKVEEAMASAEINAKLAWPMRTSNLPPGRHECDLKRHSLFEWVSKCMITEEEAHLLKLAPGPPKVSWHLTRAEKVLIARLWIGHTKATNSHILSRGPLTTCQRCGQTLTTKHMLLECTMLHEVMMNTSQLTHWGTLIDSAILHMKVS